MENNEPKKIDGTTVIMVTLIVVLAIAGIVYYLNINKSDNNLFNSSNTSSSK